MKLLQNPFVVGAPALVAGTSLCILPTGSTPGSAIHFSCIRRSINPGLALRPRRSVNGNFGPSGDRPAAGSRPSIMEFTRKVMSSKATESSALKMTSSGSRTRTRWITWSSRNVRGKPAAPIPFQSKPTPKSNHENKSAKSYLPGPGYGSVLRGNRHDCHIECRLRGRQIETGTGFRGPAGTDIAAGEASCSHGCPDEHSANEHSAGGSP